ncbi:uncharacterized protein Ecym_2160 [Eremothecium cymbalariae DBVPG|uniref:Uncharacterized protein n=1 Tax=Eremothecium cymbalariae (strain CBS 270.75 / DBVPG 7215 / KCTC 17166 / NRRL Y-17582) TaxID=931890 RepID=G8JNJ6_ERECY|nr:Hypothetical protein Ecym_2160 [Eremothecium cymbalariae DBVPG\
MPYLTPPLSNASLGTGIDVVPGAGLNMHHQQQQQQQPQQVQPQQPQPYLQSQQHGMQQPYFPLVKDGPQQLTPPLLPIPTATGVGTTSGSIAGTMNVDDTGLYRYHKKISKSFQDDLIYCPRILLNKEELNQCYQLDMLMMMEMQQQQQQQQQQQMSSGGQLAMQGIKFNPYTSQSFNPSGATSPS